jgi:hypothetical protein
MTSNKLLLTTLLTAGAMFAAPASAATVFSADLTAEQSTTEPEEAGVFGDAQAELVLNETGTYDLVMSIAFSDGIDFSAILGDGPGQIGNIVGTPDFDEDDVDATRFHIHNNVRGETGPVVFGIFDIVAPGSVVAGERQFTFLEDGTSVLTTTWNTGEGTDAGTLQTFIDDLLATMAGEDVALYYNLHTEDARAGLIRGQIVGLNDVGSDVIPIPAAAALFPAALAGGAFVRRRKQKAA